MNTQTVQLRDSSGNVWAEAQVIDHGDHFGGSIDFRMTPAPILALFGEFEEVVDGQMFAFLDEMQAKIDDLAVKVVFEDGSETSIKDLQVFPRAGELSFRLPDLPPANAGSARNDAQDAIGRR